MSQIALFSHRIQITPTTWSYFFKIESPIEFVPGQYLRWTAPIDKNSERGNKRFFTISSLPDEEMISFTTRFLGSVSPFKACLQQLVAGDELEISNPMGDFTLPGDKSVPIVMLAGGIGVTPFRSMILTALSSNPDREIHLIHGAKVAAELAFRPEFENLVTNSPYLKLRYFSEIPDKYTNQGYITADDVINNTVSGSSFYISGPEMFVETLKSELIARGIHEKDLKTDYFPGYSEI